MHEVASLEQPMSDVEMAFILEQCPIIDRDNWATSAHAAPTDPVGIQPLQNLADIVTTEPSSKLEICHVCG